MSYISVIKNKAEVPTNLVRGGFGYLKDRTSESIKKLFKKQEETGYYAGSGNVPGNVKSWIAQAIAATNSPTSWAGALRTIAMKESGGRTGPSTINKWDSNWKAGIPSMGLMQTIGPTFNAYKKAGMNDIMNPVHNAAAAINYIKARYGTPFNTPGIKSMSRGGGYLGYKTGGLIESEQMAMLGEDGDEMVIPLNKNRRSDAMKLLALTGKMLGADGGSSKRPNQMGTSKGSGNNEEISLLRQQVDLLTQLVTKEQVPAVVGFEEVYQPVKKRLNQDRYSESKRGRR